MRKSSRRSFVTYSAAAAVTGTLPIAAAAQSPSLPNIKWRCASTFPASFDVLYSSGPEVAKRVSELTGGKFTISVFQGGELVPPYKVLDAVQDGTVQCGATSGIYYTGKEEAFLFEGGIPFGMTPRQMDTWKYQHGGLDLLQGLYDSFDVHLIPNFHTGAMMTGWYRKEIKTLDDLKGIRMRMPGFLGEVFAELGAVPQQIAHGDVFSSLQKGTLDAAKLIGPYEDEKNGIWKAANYYYGPGILELDTAGGILVNKKNWNDLPDPYKAALTYACGDVSMRSVMKYDKLNPPAMQRLINNGVQLRYWSKDIMEAIHKTTFALLEQKATENERFDKLYKSWKASLIEQSKWASINDGAAASYAAALNKDLTI